MGLQGFAKGRRPKAPFAGRAGAKLRKQFAQCSCLKPTQKSTIRQDGFLSHGTSDRISLFKRQQVNDSDGGLPALLAGLKLKDTDQKELEIGTPHIGALNVGCANFSIEVSLCRDNYEIRAQ
jgi:hypothetical protein